MRFYFVFLFFYSTLAMAKLNEVQDRFSLIQAKELYSKVGSPVQLKQNMIYDLKKMYIMLPNCDKSYLKADCVWHLFVVKKWKLNIQDQLEFKACGLLDDLILIEKQFSLKVNLALNYPKDILNKIIKIDSKYYLNLEKLIEDFSYKLNFCLLK